MLRRIFIRNPGTSSRSFSFLPQHFQSPSKNLRMEYIDSHCHLDLICARLGKPLSELDILRHQFPAGFRGCIHVSCFVDRSNSGSTILEQYDWAYGTFGLHPHDALNFGEDFMNLLREQMKHHKAVAVGECGLDYTDPPDVVAAQRAAFEAQIGLAVELGKPLVVHSRDADADTLAVLQQHLPRDHPVHMHCFSGSTEFLSALLASFPNMYIGFTGAITFKNAELNRQRAASVPLNRLLLETDGPYMAPVPHRGKPATPGMIPLVAAEVAKLHNVSTDEMLRLTADNAKRLYRCWS
eukprot:TRINITY_DN23144_c0_g1_i1.p1 TRINITY_DN23144_c0_g1~~TRINITY_DN23144_c0_g1_i1.p1  ORF type:complete len:307 (-),score=51.49 TRINITY_DN23144_c0_g1_i1:68-955(-)